MKNKKRIRRLEKACIAHQLSADALARLRCVEDSMRNVEDILSGDCVGVDEDSEKRLAKMEEEIAGNTILINQLLSRRSVQPSTLSKVEEDVAGNTILINKLLSRVAVLEGWTKGEPVGDHTAGLPRRKTTDSSSVSEQVCGVWYGPGNDACCALTAGHTVEHSESASSPIEEAAHDVLEAAHDEVVRAPLRAALVLGFAMQRRRDARRAHAPRRLRPVRVRPGLSRPAREAQGKAPQACRINRQPPQQ
jgi:hypothetical protein